MLLAEYIASRDVFMVIPIINGKPDPDTEYMFDTEEEQAEFIDTYFRNPVAAIFAYHLANDICDDAEVVYGY